VQSFYFLADYHALIKCDDPARIQRSTLEIAASWLAAGLDPSGDLLPPVRHPRNPRADLAADLRHRQGPAQPRPRLQGRAVDKNTAAGSDPTTA
jgi:tryptophanyl-tRNA synthetase